MISAILTAIVCYLIYKAIADALERRKEILAEDYDDDYEEDCNESECEDEGEEMTTEEDASDAVFEWRVKLRNGDGYKVWRGALTGIARSTEGDATISEDEETEAETDVETDIETDVEIESITVDKSNHRIKRSKIKRLGRLLAKVCTRLSTQYAIYMLNAGLAKVVE